MANGGFLRNVQLLELDGTHLGDNVVITVANNLYNGNLNPESIKLEKNDIKKKEVLLYLAKKIRAAKTKHPLKLKSVSLEYNLLSHRTLRLLEEAWEGNGIKLYTAGNYGNVWGI